MKKLIVLVMLNLFIFNNIGFTAVDCSNPKKMSEKIKCKLTGNKDKKEKKLFNFKNPFKTVNELVKNIKL
jgi:hypothetical protein